MVNNEGKYEDKHLHLQSCTSDETIAILEDAINECDRNLRSVILNRLSAGMDDSKNLCHYNTLKKQRERLDKILAFLLIDTSNEYFVDHADTIYRKCDVTLIRQTPYRDKNCYKVNETRETVDDFVDIEYLYTYGLTDKLEICVSKYTALELESLNSLVRVFTCKDCGKYVEELRAIDQRMLRRGLVPRKRCNDCIAKRKRLSALKASLGK